MPDTERKAERIGDKLKEIRKKKNMSQEDVSEKLLISRQSISKWENNVCLPDLENFKKICELYELEPGELLAQSGFIMEGGEERTEIPVTATNTVEWNITSFLIPFYWLYFLKKRLYKSNFSNRIFVLVALNIMISIGVVYFVCCGVPKTTSIPSVP